MKEKIKQYFLRKSKFGLAADFLVVTLLIASLIPQSRMVIMTFLVQGRMLMMQPSLLDADEGTMLVDTDYQISLKDLQGNKFETSAFKSKVVFLNFWATWCPPCVAEMPAIQKLYDSYKDNSDVMFLLVSNEAPEVVRKFIAKNGYTFPVYLQNGKLPGTFSAMNIPTTYVVSKAGKLVIRETGAVNWAGERMTTIMESLIK
jgi:thiol-disulfide isomerase/thioredoxin